MIKETIQRFKSETPEYWVKIRNASISLCLVASLFVGLDQYGICVPKIILNISQFVLAIGATLGISAQATVKK